MGRTENNRYKLNFNVIDEKINLVFQIWPWSEHYLEIKCQVDKYTNVQLRWDFGIFFLESQAKSIT